MARKPCASRSNSNSLSSFQKAMNFFGFFSIFPALTLAFAVFGFVLRGQPSVFHDVVHSISTTLPGVFWNVRPVWMSQ